MKEKKKNVVASIIISVAILIFVVFGLLACFGDFREFDAKGYVKVMLDKTFKGEVQAVVELTNGTVTEEEILAQYEATVTSFANSRKPEDMQLSEDMQEQYISICKKLFASMKYDVKEAVKISDTEYEVPVEYQPTNVCEKFETLILEENQRIYKKKENGEYRGTTAEIDAKMKQEFTSAFCSLFEEAYNTMEIGEKETIVIKVVREDDDLYKIDSAQINELIKKILGLDVIQD